MARPAIVHIDLGHLRHNYRLLEKQAGAAGVMAVVKANAYGHGMSLVATTLLGEGCRSFAVTDARAGVELRSMVDSGFREIEISLLSGVFDAEDAMRCVDSYLTPVVSEAVQIEWLKGCGFNGSVWLKLNSGMNRLGAAASKVLFSLSRDAEVEVRGFMSHLACADEQEHPMNQLQVQQFISDCDAIAPGMPRSLLNSAGLLAMPEYAFDVVRPGIALYGAEPIADRTYGLKPVMTLEGEIIQLRDIQPGDCVSYGASFVAARPMIVAVVSVGYADGVPRQLSNAGFVYISGRQCPIIGRVCMDYSMVDVTGYNAKLGDRVEFWGQHVLANDVAKQVGTISYTLFTGVGERVVRVAR